MRSVFKNYVIGPEYPVVSRVKNQFIKQLLIKVDRNANSKRAKELIKSIIDDFGHNQEYRSVVVSVDVDPI